MRGKVRDVMGDDSAFTKVSVSVKKGAKATRCDGVRTSGILFINCTPTSSPRVSVTIHVTGKCTSACTTRVKESVAGICFGPRSTSRLLRKCTSSLKATKTNSWLEWQGKVKS